MKPIELAQWPPLGVDWYYADKSVCIAHGDCREIVPTLGKFDLLLTDPPYGLGEAAGKNKSRSVLAHSVDYGNDTWDTKPAEWNTISRLIGVAKNACVFGGNFYPVPSSSAWLIWDKENGANDFADCELAWTNYGCAVRLKRHRWHGMLRKNNETRQHPTQKPLDVMVWAISLCPGEPQTILDPFAGSCTTARAAKDLGRKCVCIEREEKYCEIGAERMRQEVFDFGACSDEKRA